MAGLPRLTRRVADWDDVAAAMADRYRAALATRAAV